MSKRWSKAEIAHLQRHAADHSVEELGQKLHTDVASVRRKLSELGLVALGEAPAPPPPAPGDGAVEHYDQGLRQLYAKHWKEAAAIFSRVIGETDSRQLADRARQHLEICRRQLAEEAATSDPYLRAVYEKNRGSYDAALALCLEQRKATNDERWTYLLASLRALTGASDEALELLATAIRLEPKNRVHAYHDPDFSDLRSREEFRRLLAGT